MAGPSLAIRHARDEDAGAIADLCVQLGYAATADEIASRLRKLLAMPTQAVFVACDEDDSVRGYIATEQRLLLESGAHVEIVGLAVDAAHRRGGAGRALLTAAESWAYRRGVSRLRVRSNVLREEAHAFYPGMGYALDKTQHCYLRDLA
ncbi:GNAT family N-acetyltransferase [Solilutibacter oculi]|uniref:GNAT family N-acetyltransferase n=1 Tax=Solilutibacter oculi TaxID=2698682 RepID=UPI0013A61358|nr:GNAT family N-acetyltransferase [Lysobacter oculi]